MKIALSSDLHIGTTNPKAIIKLFKKLHKEETVDLIALLGDFCGGFYGARSVASIIKIVRNIFPTIPIITTIGNHDYWVRGILIKEKIIQRNSTYPPSLSVFLENYNQIVAAFKENNVHFLDLDGVYRNVDFPGIAFVGHTLWYGSRMSVTKTNDSSNIPIGIEGDTYSYMYKTAMNQCLNNLDQLCDNDLIRIFCSHFPVVGAETDRDFMFGGDFIFGEQIGEQYKIDKFFNGHTHKLYTGPIRYECGSDYWNPKYLIVNI